MPPGGCPQTCEIVVVGGATHSCLLALPDIPARHRGGEGQGQGGRGEAERGEGRGREWGVERRERKEPGKGGTEEREVEGTEGEEG